MPYEPVGAGEFVDGLGAAPSVMTPVRAGVEFEALPVSRRPPVMVIPSKGFGGAGFGLAAVSPVSAGFGFAGSTSLAGVGADIAVAAGAGGGGTGSVGDGGTGGSGATGAVRAAGADA